MLSNCNWSAPYPLKYKTQIMEIVQYDKMAVRKRLKLKTKINRKVKQLY